MKKGFIFTLDAAVGITIVIAIILSFNFLKLDVSYQADKYQKLNYRSQDVMNVLSNLKVSEIQDNQVIQQLISEGKIIQEDLEKSILDIATSFFYADNKTVASQILEDTLQNISSDVCTEVTIFSESSVYETLYQSCSKTDDDEYAVSSKIETGYDIGKPTEGFTARSFLSSISGKTTSSYLYFGGYVGDGNITKNITLPPFNEIQEVYLEADVGGDFTLYINDNYAGDYVKGSAGGGNMTADKWQINSSYFQYFSEGNNTVNFNFTGSNDYIGGGYLRVTYDTSQLAPEDEVGIERYWFPGIHGFINIYSSFYVPGDLTGMSAHLHYKNEYTTYLDIGGVDIFTDNQTGERTLDITNSTFSGLLSYGNLSIKTIPIRLGTEALTMVGSGNADVILITDVSGSMNWRLGSTISGQTRNCDDPELYDPKTKRISLAKCLDRQFIDIILNSSGNRVGLIGYSGSPNYMCTGGIGMIRSYHDLSIDSESLYGDVQSYSPTGATGICGALRQARQMLEEQSDSSRQKFIIIMTDGLANVDCDPVNEDSIEGCIPNKCPFSWACECFGVEDCLYEECGDWVSELASNNSIEDACKAHEDADATIYSIGFGPVASCPIGNQTLQGIANCGDGEYYASQDAYELEEIYRTIAEGIVELTYQTQIIEVTGNVSEDNILYPDSYIEFNYDPLVTPYDYGEISITRETSRLGDLSGYDIDLPDKEGWFNVSEQIKIVDAKITSYSSSYWTDRLYVKNSTDSNWTRVYWLEDYDSDYTGLGDPYIIQIPVDLIGIGNNSVRIGTGFSSLNATGGSPDDRVIYTARVKGSVGYGDVFSTSQLATDDALQRLIDKIENYVDIEADDISVENETIGGMKWLWGPSLVKVIVWEK